MIRVEKGLRDFQRNCPGGRSFSLDSSSCTTQGTVNSFGCTQWMIPEVATNNVEGEGCFVFWFHSVCLTLCHNLGGGGWDVIPLLSSATDGVWRNSRRRQLDCHWLQVVGICFIFVPCFCNVRREIMRNFISFEWYVLERGWNGIWGFNGFWKAAAMWRRIMWLETPLGYEALLQSFIFVPLQSRNRLFSRKRGTIVSLFLRIRSSGWDLSFLVKFRDIFPLVTFYLSWVGTMAMHWCCLGDNLVIGLHIFPFLWVLLFSTQV